jgi:membrane protease YdiL (CAAX protease family)
MGCAIGSESSRAFELISYLHAALVIFLVVGLPLWDRRETRLLREQPSATHRIRSYQKTIGWLWLASLLLLATVPADTLFRPALSLEFLSTVREHRVFWPAMLGMLIALMAGLVLPVIMARRNPTAAQQAISQYARIWFFMPYSATERWWFAGACLSAGICEEIIYRGFLIPFLATGPVALGPWGAILIAAIVFGLAHGYQGWTGMVATGVIALLMTTLFIASGHLWLPMLVHALMDIRILLLWPSKGLTPETVRG